MKIPLPGVNPEYNEAVLTSGNRRYAGVGNLSAVILSDSRERNLVSQNGTMGDEVRKIQEIMPDMSGFEMLDRLGSDPATHDIPLIVISSKVLTEAEQRRLSRAVAILSKASSSRQDALARLKEALAEAEASRRRPAAQGAPNVH